MQYSCKLQIWHHLVVNQRCFSSLASRWCCSRLESVTDTLACATFMDVILFCGYNQHRTRPTTLARQSFRLKEHLTMRFPQLLNTTMHAIKKKLICPRCPFIAMLFKNYISGLIMNATHRRQTVVKRTDVNRLIPQGAWKCGEVWLHLCKASFI